MNRRVRRWLLTAVAAGLLTMSMQATAFGYGHTWSCSVAYSGSQCYDTDGQQYNPWYEVDGQVGLTVHEVCAKGVTAAGNIRTGSTCLGGASFVVACFQYPTPDSLAYVYWDGSGGPYAINGHATTDICN